MTKINLNKVIGDTESFLRADLAPVEGKRVGRSFTVETDDYKITVKFKELVDHLHKLAKEESQRAIDSKELQGRIHQVVLKLEGLNYEGEVNLYSGESHKKRTAIHRFFGNLGRKPHVELLHSIDKKYGQLSLRQKFYAQLKGRKEFSDSEIRTFKKLIKNSPQEIDLFLFELKKMEPKVFHLFLSRVIQWGFKRDEFSLIKPWIETSSSLMEIYENTLPPKPLLTPLSKKTSKIAVKKERPEGRPRTALHEECQKLAAAFPTLKLDQPNLSQGLYNPDNSCYMNASLQNLERLYITPQSAAANLTKQNLMRLEGETLEALEERLLKQWAPIPPLPEGSSAGKVQERQDRILFKWNFLLLIQTKRFAPDTLKSALDTHLNVCFSIQRHPELKKGIHQQQDAASYFELWHDMLGFHFSAHFEREATYLGAKLHKTFPSNPMHILSLGFDKIDKTKGDISLIQLIKKNFNYELIDDGYAFEIKKTKVSPQVQQEQQRFDGVPPETLSIQLKRWETKIEPGGIITKKNKDPIPLGFNPEEKRLNLKPIFQDGVSRDELSYRLSGIVVHHGSTPHNGHYIAYILNPEGTGWLECNDSTITPIKADQVPFHDAYLLTFQRITPKED